MSGGLPETNVVPGIKPGNAHAMSNATATMKQATGVSTKDAAQTYAKMQPVNTKATVSMVAAIWGAP